MNTCRTCNFYSTTQEEFQTKPEGQCACPKFRYAPDTAEIADDELGYWDFESCAAGFNVGPNFGCIHWSAK